VLGDGGEVAIERGLQQERSQGAARALPLHKNRARTNSGLSMVRP
jgi:hypothetical protein